MNETSIVSERRTKEDMRDENEELFHQVFDLRAANVQRRRLFDYAFTTGPGKRELVVGVDMDADGSNSKVGKTVR